MSTPSPAGATAPAPASAAVPAAAAPAPAAVGAPTAVPATPGRPSRWRGLTSSTPRMLRVLRTTAAAAALLTGVAATGTFDTEGVNATPNVVAAQWTAGERALVDLARADVLGAERVAGAAAGEADEQGLRDGFDDALGSAAQGAVGAGAEDAAAGALARFATGVERSVAQGAEDAGAAAGTYQRASTEAADTVALTRAATGQHAEDLRTGFRSPWTAGVGGLSTLLLGGIAVWLALRTRRILNVPLLIATAITAGLTYVSLNPTEVPLTYDQRIAEAQQSVTALEQVHLLRQEQYALALGLDPAGTAAPQRTTEVLAEAGSPEEQEAWAAVVAAGEEVGAADGLTGRLAAIEGSRDDLDTVVQALTDRVDEQLGQATRSVGVPAALTSGVALLAGLVAAGLAWSGLTRRLRDYR